MKKTYILVVGALSILVSCAVTGNQNTSQVEPVIFREIDLKSDEVKKYPFLDDLIETIELSEKQRGSLDISIAKLDGYPLDYSLLLVSVQAPDTCGSHGCLLEYYQALDGKFIRIPNYMVSNKKIFKLTCGSKLFLLHEGSLPVGTGVWKYEPDEKMLFIHKLNTRDIDIDYICNEL